MSVIVCLSVCPPVYLPNHTRDFTQFFVHVANGRGRGSVLLQLGDAIPRGGEGAIWGVFFPTDNALYGSYSGMNFATKDRFCLNLLLYRKVGKNSISDY